MLYIVIDEADLEKRTNQFIDDIHNFHNKHIIQCYSETKPTLPEDPHYISSMTPTGFINGQYELRFYVNSLFQVIFFNIFFRQLIMNIDCEKIIENLDNSEDNYRAYIQKIMILQVIQQIFCKMLIGGRKVFTLICFSK